MKKRLLSALLALIMLLSLVPGALIRTALAAETEEPTGGVLEGTNIRWEYDTGIRLLKAADGTRAVVWSVRQPDGTSHFRAVLQDGSGWG